MADDIATTAGNEEDAPSEAAGMTFTEHLDELRIRMVRVAIALLLGFFVGFAFRDPLFELMAAPLKEALAKHGIYNFRAIEITETIFVYLKLALVAGIMGTLPYTFYQLWAFIAPGLLEREKRAVAPLVFFSTFFFALGTYFAYEVIVPFIAEYLAALTMSNPDIAMDVTVQSAFSFSIKLLLAFGVAFELPLVMFFLAFLGLVQWQQYAKAFRFFIVVSFIVAAVLTPPDPVSQLLMAVPLNVLYWVGVGAAFAVGRRREDGARSFSIPSRVWGALTVSLMLIGTAIGAGTWWLGQKHSPLQWVPDDAAWVASVRFQGDEIADLRGQLQLPEGAPETAQVIEAGGPDGERLLILVGGCAEAGTHAVGECAGDDLLIGEGAWLEKAKSGESGLQGDPVCADLMTRAPIWGLDRRPDKARLGLLPGQGDLAGLVSVTATADLRGDEPWLEVRFEPTDSGVLTSLQNRVDIWRSEAARRKELVESAAKMASSDTELLKLLREVLDLTDRRLKRLEPGAADAAELAELRGADAALRKRLAGRLTALTAAGVEIPAGSSLLDDIGQENIRTWRTTIDGAGLVLRIELTAPGGVSAIVGLL